MLEAQLHYPVFKYDAFGRRTETYASAAKHGVRRVFRIGETKPISRDQRAR
jgi:hypothetical protein